MPRGTFHQGPTLSSLQSFTALLPKPAQSLGTSENEANLLPSPSSRLASRLLTWELGGPKPPGLKVALTSSQAIFRVLSALESAGASGHTPPDQASQAFWLPCGHRLRPQQRPAIKSGQHWVTGLTLVVVCGAVSPKAPLGANLCRMQDGDGREELACTEP